MASPAVARERETSSIERRKRDWLPLLLALLIQLGTLAYFAGRITERVDSIGADVQMLKQAILQNQFKR